MLQKKFKIGLFLRLISFWFVCMVPLSAASSSKDIKTGQLHDLETILGEVETHYGMTERKEKWFGVTVERLRETYRAMIQKAVMPHEVFGKEIKDWPPSNRGHLSREEFQQVLIALAAEFEDGHFNILRDQSLRAWTLGIHAAEIEGKLFVTGFDETTFTKGSAFPEVKEGDEIVGLDGVPIEELAKDILPYISLATPNSKLKYAYRFLMNRPHRWLQKLETGKPVTVNFRRKNPEFKLGDDKSGAKPYIEFEGTYHWTDTKDFSDLKNLFRFETKKSDGPYIFGMGGPRSYFSEGIKKSKELSSKVISYARLLNQEIEIAKSRQKGEAKESIDVLDPDQLKSLADLEPVDSLPVYLVRSEGKTIGVLRIPDYSFLEDEMKWLSEVISRLENLTDALIIDHSSNGGGFVWSGAQLARLFASEKELESVNINVRISERYLKAIEQWESDQDQDNEQSKINGPRIGSDDLNTPNHFGLAYLRKEHREALRKKLEAGEKYSGPIPFMATQPLFKSKKGGRIVARESSVYTKPILILNDSRSASCGDFFPAILQSNGRALVIGETSMGLGGPVFRTYDALTRAEVSMRCTFGYCERSDGLPIENVGVVPDLPRWVLPEDLHGGFSGFSEDIIKVATRLASGESKATIVKDYLSQYQKNKNPSEEFRVIDEKYGPLFSDINIAPLKLKESYQGWFQSIRALGEKGKLSDADWRSVSVPLPMRWLNKDLILSTQRRPDEIRARLFQLDRLPGFEVDAGWKDLLKYLIDELKLLPGLRRNVCFEDLRHFTKN